MPKQTGQKFHIQKVRTDNETQSEHNQSHSIFQDSQELDSEFIVLDKEDKRILKSQGRQCDNFNKQRKEISTDGQYKDSLRQKKSPVQEISQENNLQESVEIEESQQHQSQKSQIVARYKLGKDQQVFRIDLKNQKQQSALENSKIRLKNPHWHPIQIPDDLFEDTNTHENQSNTRKSITKSSEQKSSNELLKGVKKENNSIKNENLLNPLAYFKNVRQSENQTQFLNPSFTQHVTIPNYQSQNSQFISQTFGKPQFNQNVPPPMQNSPTGNCIPPFSPRSDLYWQSFSPQQQYLSYPQFYGGAQLVNEMRYLREEVKLLRQQINYQRKEKQFKARQKRQHDRSFEKFEKILETMKSTIETERQQHRSQLQEISKKFTDEISKLKSSNLSLIQQNQSLKTYSQIRSSYESMQDTKLNFRQHRKENFSKKSTRNVQILDEILNKKIYSNDEKVHQHTFASKQSQLKNKRQNTSKRRKQSGKKSSSNITLRGFLVN